MKKENRFKKLKYAAIGAAITLAIMVAVPVLARVVQETIEVTFNDIRITVDGQQVQTEYEPFIYQERTYLPVRDVANATGFDVEWEGSTNTVHLTSPQDAETSQDLQTQISTSGEVLGTIVVPATVVPRSPARAGGPTNPAITAQRAAELARDHLIDIGVTSARFDYIYMDREGSAWVWSVEFDGQGISYEFYVDVSTGAFLKAPSVAGVSRTPSTSTPTTSATAGSRPSNPAISLERAIEIAEADLRSRGINATYRSNSGMSWERGQWVWELLFRTQGERMPFIEYYINVDNGDIVKFEWDD